ncbi:MAG: glutamine-hydrolyzing carbamoyl-phosphate synthase small subunit [Thermodesulfobacteriota bacterium]
MKMHLSQKAVLALADGTIFEGESIGAKGEGIGEVVFNTSMTGYQEIITDPSYKGQIVTMTYPMIGNYGINKEDVESHRPFLEGFVVKELCPYPSNWRSGESLHSFLERWGVVGIQGIDTRALTRHIRDSGAQQAIVSTVDSNKKILLEKVREAPTLVGRDLVKKVTCNNLYRWQEGPWSKEAGYTCQPQDKVSQFRVVVYDFGVKYNILRQLFKEDCDIIVCPATTSAEDILSLNPDGIFLSNGPGDPEGVPYAIKNVTELIGKKPIFGICLGHQILALALGGKSFKLKFGHHGGNHPVMDLSTNKVEITAQNHGFAVDIDSLNGDVELTHINLNDRTVEGLSHKELPVFSVQYHPEASPGPHDSSYLFKRFVEVMRGV